MGGIVWLASYPKSGNTWVRAFLTHYLRQSEPFDLDELEGEPIGTARAVFDELVGLEASDLTASEVDRYRSDVYRGLVARNARRLFIKIHDACFTDDCGNRMPPCDATSAAVYLVRNPLDVAVSMAHHFGTPVSDAVASLCCEQTVINQRADGIAEHLPQRLGSWSSHVSGWIEPVGFPVEIVRYEDLVRAPNEEFARVVRTCGLEVDADRVASAREQCRFDRLQGLEREHGFGMRPASMDRFFRRGVVGEWRTALTESHVRQIVESQRSMMTRLGYLTETGELLT